MAGSGQALDVAHQAESAPDPARRKRATSLPPDERRSMIISAALPLLLEHGEAVTTYQIAQAAGIAEGTVFRVFDTKEELIEAVIDRFIDRGPTERAIAALDTSVGIEQAVVAVVKLVQARVAEVWQLISSVGPHFHRHARRPSFDSPALTEMLGSFRADLAIPPARAARYLRSVIMAASHPLMTEEPAPPEEIASLFLHGASRRPC